MVANVLADSGRRLFGAGFVERNSGLKANRAADVAFCDLSLHGPQRTITQLKQKRNAAGCLGHHPHVMPAINLSVKKLHTKRCLVGFVAGLDAVAGACVPAVPRGGSSYGKLSSGPEGELLTWEVILERKRETVLTTYQDRGLARLVLTSSSWTRTYAQISRYLHCAVLACCASGPTARTCPPKPQPQCAFKSASPVEKLANGAQLLSKTGLTPRTQGTQVQQKRLR